MSKATRLDLVELLKNHPCCQKVGVLEPNLFHPLESKVIAVQTCRCTYDGVLMLLLQAKKKKKVTAAAIAFTFLADKGAG